jgi:hypothetical protein
MKEIEPPPRNLVQWMEFCWLFLTSRTFRAAPDKRRAYLEHCMSKWFNLWLY